MKKNIEQRTIAAIVTYNRLPVLKDCIVHLLLQNAENFDILVVNNASTDGTDNYLSSIADERIKILSLKENTGGAGGFNAAMRYACEMGYRYCWVMDDDCMADVGALSELLSAAELLEKQGEDYGFLASLVLWKGGSVCKMNRVKWRWKYYDDIAGIPKQIICPAEQSTFVSMFLKTGIIKKVGLPVKDFFIWGDDVEFSRRIAVRNKIQSYLVPGSIVYHATPNNNGSDLARETDTERMKLYSFAYRNEGWTYRQEGLKGNCYYGAKCILNLGKILIKGKGNKADKIAILLKAFVAGCYFKPELEFPR